MLTTLGTQKACFLIAATVPFSLGLFGKPSQADSKAKRYVPASVTLQPSVLEASKAFLRGPYMESRVTSTEIRQIYTYISVEWRGQKCSAGDKYFTPSDMKGIAQQAAQFNDAFLLDVRDTQTVDYKSTQRIYPGDILVYFLNAEDRVQKKYTLLVVYDYNATNWTVNGDIAHDKKISHQSNFPLCDYVGVAGDMFLLRPKDASFAKVFTKSAAQKSLQR